MTVRGCILCGMHTPPLILLVDDEPQIRDLFKAKLESSGFGVVEAADGAAAIDLVRKEKPDLVLLDVLMPGMDGGKTLTEMKSDADMKNVPVFILTSLQDTPEDIRFAKESGAVDFINKDVDFGELVAKIKGALSM